MLREAPRLIWVYVVMAGVQLAVYLSVNEVARSAFFISAMTFLFVALVFLLLLLGARFAWVIVVLTEIKAAQHGWMVSVEGLQFAPLALIHLALLLAPSSLRYVWKRPAAELGPTGTFA